VVNLSNGLILRRKKLRLMKSHRHLILFLLALASSTLAQPRPPHARPPNNELNYDCLADPALPDYVPALDKDTSSVMYVPQSDTTYYVMARWILGFSQYYPNIVINAPVIGSGIAGPCLTDGSCNFSVIGREVLLAEMAPFVAKFGYNPFEYPLAGGSYAALAFTDAMTVMVHPSNPLRYLSFAQFDAIFSTTRNRGYPEDISTWGQLGLTGAWAGKPINLVGVEIPNGFELFLNKTMLLGGTWKSNILTRKTVFELATLVSLDPYSFGYTGLAFLNATVNQLALYKDGGWPYIETAQGHYYEASKQNVCARNYPLSRLIYLYANKVPGKPLNPVILEFLNYVLSNEGQKAVQDDMIFLPLPLSVVRQLRSQLGLPTA